MPDRLLSASTSGTGVIQLMTQPADTRITPKEYLEQRLGLQSITNGQALTVNGLPAYTGTAVVNTDVGRRLARISVIYLYNSAFILMGRTQDPNGLSRYDNFFLETTRSFRPLNNDERAIAGKNNRIRVFRADESTSFDGLAASTSVDKFPEDQLRLINGMYPDGEIQNGELAKTIQN
jgi:predicted Zn-dependent protease